MKVVLITTFNYKCVHARCIPVLIVASPLAMAISHACAISNQLVYNILLWIKSVTPMKEGSFC